MKIKRLSSVVVVLFITIFSVLAGDKVVTMIDGVDSGRVLTKITFDDSDYITLIFSDNTSERVDMSLVEVSFGNSAGSALENIASDRELPRGVYNLKGQRVAETPDGLVPGLYIINGEKIIVR